MKKKLKLSYRLLKVNINYAGQTKLKFNPLKYNGGSITNGKFIPIIDYNNNYYNTELDKQIVLNLKY